MGIILLVLSGFLYAVLIPINIIHLVIDTFRWNNAGKSRWKYINDYCRSSAYAIDKAGNVFAASFLNAVGVKRGGYLHGNPDETISCVVGYNQWNEKAQLLGIGLRATLNAIDFYNWNKGGHCFMATPRSFREGKTPKNWKMELFYVPPFVIFLSALIYGLTKLLIWILQLFINLL